MLYMFARSWWSVLLRGLALLALGVATFVWPQLTLFALIYAFAAFALVDGIFSLVALRSPWGSGPWWAQLAGGLLSLAAGVVALIMPGLTAVVLLYVIAFWAVARGAMDIVVAIALRKEISNEWALILAGVVSIVFGVVLIFQPGAGILGFLLLLGLFAVVAGLALVVVAFRLRAAAKRMERAAEARAA